MINHFGQTFGFNFTDVSNQGLQPIFGKTVTDTLRQVPSQTYHHGSAGVYRFESPLKVNKHSICNIVTISYLMQFILPSHLYITPNRLAAVKMFVYAFLIRREFYNPRNKFQKAFLKTNITGSVGQHFK
jgi:hypothetical protein